MTEQNKARTLTVDGTTLRIHTRPPSTITHSCREWPKPVRVAPVSLTIESTDGRVTVSSDVVAFGCCGEIHLSDFDDGNSWCEAELEGFIHLIRNHWRLGGTLIGILVSDEQEDQTR